MNTQCDQRTPWTFRLLFVGLIALAVAIGCDGSGDVSDSSDFDDSADLLGLTDNCTLVYLRTDSIRDSLFNLHVSTAQDTIIITGEQDDWVIGTTARPVVSLKISNHWVIQNGYWPPTDGSQDIVYFAVPPMMMIRQLTSGAAWDGYFPLYSLGTEEVQHLFFTSYFGFHFSKSYSGQTQLSVPAGVFNASAFQVRLFQSYYAIEPAATAHEYYVPDVGLVQLSFQAGAFKRVLSLVSYN